MTSSVNPALIDSSVPTAGTDNPSSGLRNNFSATALNFQFAANELSDLQAKAVLKSALTGSSLDNDMQGSLLLNAQTQGFSQTAVAHGTNSGTINFSYSAGQFHSITTNGTVNVRFTDWPVLGVLGTLAIEFTISDVSHTLTFPTSVTVNTVGIAGFNSSTNVFTAPVAGVYTFSFTCYDGGFNYTLAQDNTVLQALNSSYETVASGGTCSPGVASSLFSTTGTSTATLAAGTNGATKTLVMSSAGGAMTVTVAAAGWRGGASGTVTLTHTGDTATLLVINGRWFAIGSVGAVFA